MKKTLLFLSAIAYFGLSCMMDADSPLGSEERTDIESFTLAEIQRDNRFKQKCPTESGNYAYEGSVVKGTYENHTISIVSIEFTPQGSKVFCTTRKGKFKNGNDKRKSVSFAPTARRQLFSDEAPAPQSKKSNRKKNSTPIKPTIRHTTLASIIKPLILIGGISLGGLCILKLSRLGLISIKKES